jgi:hypothetical protein
MQTRRKHEGLMTSAGEIDWRSTELNPEDFYAA